MKSLPKGIHARKVDGFVASRPYREKMVADLTRETKQS